MDLKQYGKQRRGLFERKYFRPDPKNLLNPIVARFSFVYVLFPLLVTIVLFTWVFNHGEVFLFFWWPIPVIIWTVRIWDDIRIHKMQMIFMQTGVPPRQISKWATIDKLWDEVEQRHRYAANDFA